MAKQYDKILKENIEQIFLPLAEKYLSIKIVKTENLPEKVQVTDEREPDFNKIVITDTGEKFILHMEFQTTDDTDMIYRVAEYKAMKMRKFKMVIRSIVIYFGMEKPRMRTQLKEEEVIRGFELLNIHELDPKQILESKIPEEIILSILGNYPLERAGVIIKRVIERLKELCEDEIRFNKYLKQLTILSRLRNLELETKNTIEHMPITYDITKDGLYREGKKEGILEERKRRNHEVAENLLKRGMSIQEVGEITTLSRKEVIKISQKLKK